MVCRNDHVTNLGAIFGDPLGRIQIHIKSKLHKTKSSQEAPSSSGLIKRFFNKNVWLEDSPPQYQQVQTCQGFYKDTVFFHKSQENLQTEVLLKDVVPGTDDGKRSWYVVPFHRIHNSVGSSVGTFHRIHNSVGSSVGTFKHLDCVGIVKDHKKDLICRKCKQIPTLKSFRLRLQARHKPLKNGKGSKHIRFDNLNSDKQHTLLKQKTENTNLQSKLFFAQTRCLRLLQRKQTLSEQLKEFSCRGDMAAIVNKLIRAQSSERRTTTGQESAMWFAWQSRGEDHWGRQCVKYCRPHSMVLTSTTCMSNLKAAGPSHHFNTCTIWC